jgi:hypothetical protein
MRYIVIGLLLVISMGWGSSNDPVWVVYADTDPRAVRIASLKLQLHLAQNQRLETRFKQHGLTIRTCTFAPYTALCIGPIRTRSARNDMRLLLGARYPQMFFVRPSDTARATPKTMRVASHARRSPDGMRGWIWYGLGLVALMGVIAALYHRKRLSAFRHTQEVFASLQERLNRTLDTWSQGGSHA